MTDVRSLPPRWTCAGCAVQVRSDGLPARWSELLGDVRCARCSSVRSPVPDAGPLPDGHVEIAATAMLGGVDEPRELVDLEGKVFGVTFEFLARTRPGNRHERARDAGLAAQVLPRTLVEGQTVQTAASQLAISKRTAERAKSLALDAITACRREPDGELPEPSATVAALFRDVAA